MSARSVPACLAVALLASTFPASAGDKDAEPQKIPLGIRVVEDPPSVVVREVVPRQIGYRMGLVAGDVIVAINGTKVKSFKQFRELLQTREATVVWKGKDGVYYRNTVRIVESALPDAPPEFELDGFKQAKTLKGIEAGAPGKKGAGADN